MLINWANSFAYVANWHSMKYCYIKNDMWLFSYEAFEFCILQDIGSKIYLNHDLCALHLTMCIGSTMVGDPCLLFKQLLVSSMTWLNSSLRVRSLFGWLN